MKDITIIIVIAICGTVYQNSIAKGPYDYEVLRAIDGDTIEFVMPGLPDELGDKMKLRIYGIDTPEKGHRAQCKEEALKGEKATKYAKQIVDTAAVLKVEIRDWDKFGGRVLGDLLVNGKSFREIMIQKGYAREYYGDKKQTWCKND